MYGLALCLPSVGQPQGLPVPHEILKTPDIFSPCRRLPLSSCWVYPRPPPPLKLFSARFGERPLAKPRRWVSPPSLWDRRGMGLQSKPTNLLPLTKCHFMTVVSISGKPCVESGDPFNPQGGWLVTTAGQWLRLCHSQVRRVIVFVPQSIPLVPECLTTQNGR